MYAIGRQKPKSVGGWHAGAKEKAVFGGCRRFSGPVFFEDKKSTESKRGRESKRRGKFMNTHYFTTVRSPYYPVLLSVYL
jgi:hypothetical protein